MAQSGSFAIRYVTHVNREPTAVEQGQWVRKGRQLTRQNFISSTTVRDITTLRQDFLSALAQLGFLGTPKEVKQNSVNSNNDNLVKAIIVGGLYPRIARIALPTAQFERVQQGTIQKDVRAPVPVRPAAR
jgi:hypothetical protein